MAARMLEKTTNKSQQREEEGFYWRLKMFDPAVPGFIFWAIILGWCFCWRHWRCRSDEPATKP